MSLKLTKKQRQVMGFVSDFINIHHYSPSYREIMSGLGLSSVSAVAEHIDNLVFKGALRKVPGTARSLEVVDTTYKETVMLFQTKLASATPEETEILQSAADLLGLDLSTPLQNA